MGLEKEYDNPHTKIEKDLLQQEIMKQWMEEGDKAEADWEKEMRIDFDIAFDLLVEDSSRNLDVEMRENPIKVINDLKAELKVLRQIEVILSQKAGETDSKTWKVQHRHDLIDIMHRMKEHDAEFLEKAESQPGFLQNELNEIEIAA